MTVRTLIFAILTFAAGVSAQQPPCDFVPEQQIPNCRFTARSNYALHGRVHTMRVAKRDVAPDPRTSRPNQRTQYPKLWVQEPGAWAIFSLEGEVLETAGSFWPDGTPRDAMRQQKTTAGSTTRVESEIPGKPNGVTRDDKFDDEGNLVEQVAYVDGKLFSRHIQKHDASRRVVEDVIYDREGNVISDSSETFDAHGRTTESIIVDHARMVQHIRDTYDETSDDDGANMLIARGFYDERGLFREIRLRNGQISSWWQRTECGESCAGSFHHAVRLNFPFDHLVDYEIQPDGSLLTTIERHSGRYGNIDNDVVEVLKDNGGAVVERIAYRYVRDEHGNWTERVTSILDTKTGQMVDVRVDQRELTYY